MAAPAHGKDSVQRIEFDIPRMRAADALMQFADQSSTPLLVSFDLVDSVEANAIRGTYSLDEAVSRLLRGTGLEGKVNAVGVLVVTRALQEEKGQDVIDSKGFLASVSSLVVGALTAGNSVAIAQEMVRDELVVTAQKREQSVNDVPISISAYGAEQISDFGIRSAEDLSMITPGLVVNQSAGTGTSVWTIRGVGFNDYSTSGSSTVGIYFDEIAKPYPVMATGQFYDTERVEVLKGPQGDLYGRNTTAGQVNFVSRKPTEEFEAGGSLSFGRYNTLDVEGYMSGPLNDAMRARLAFKTVHATKGWQESLSRPGDRLGEKEVYSVRGIVDWDVAANVSAELIAHFNQDNSDGVASTAVNGILIGQDFPTLRGAPFNTVGELESSVIFSRNENTAADWTNGPDNALRPKRDNTLWGLVGRLTWDFGNVEVVSVTGYDSFERNESNDWDGTALLDSSNINITDIEVFSQELRASSQIGDNIYWLAGVYYSFDNLNEDYNYFFGEGRFGINQLNTNYRQDTDSIAGFAHLEWDITDRLGLNLGGRYTAEDRTWEGCTYDATPTDIPVAGLPLHVFLNNIINGPGVLTPNGLLNDAFNIPNGLPLVTPLAPNGCGTFNDILGTPGAGQFGVFSRTIEANKWMWKFGFDYALADDVLLFANVSHGFKSGGFNGANSNTHSQLVPYQPEELTAYEVGLKAGIGAAQWNTSVFYYDYTDKQERSLAVTPVGNISGLANVPESRIIGVETDFNWRPTDRLTVYANGVFLDTKIKQYMAVSQASSYPATVYFDASGAELENAPKWSANFGVSYHIPVGSFELTPSFDGLYRDETSGDSTEGVSAVDAYFLGNARLSIVNANDDRWRLSLWSRNVFDTDYYVSAFGGGNFTYVRTNGMPRTYGFTIDVKL